MTTRSMACGAGPSDCRFSSRLAVRLNPDFGLRLSQCAECDNPPLRHQRSSSSSISKAPASTIGTLVLVEIRYFRALGGRRTG
jgi:hypothetical protein